MHTGVLERTRRLDFGDGRGRARICLHAANSVTDPDVVALPVVEPEFWRVVNLITVRGRPYSPGAGALVQEAMRKKWFGDKAISTRLAEENQADQ